MITDIVIFALSLALLWKGGHLLIKGASGMASSTGMGSFLVGFTLVAIGTSFPEFLVCLMATVKGSSDIAVGNMVGSNIANVGFILGATVIISPIFISKSAWREQKLSLVFLLIITLAVCVFCYTGFLLKNREGMVIFSALVAFLIFEFRKPTEKVEKSRPRPRQGVLKLVSYLILGSAFLASGAYFLVDAAVRIAEGLGISELFIGVTVVAIGTSLPELAASLIAAWKREQDIVMGSIIGSNFFNLSFLGLVATVNPIQVQKKMFSFSEEFEFGFLVILTVALAGLIIKARDGRKIGRWQGVVLLVIYAVFLYFATKSFS